MNERAKAVWIWVRAKERGSKMGRRKAREPEQTSDVDNTIHQGFEKVGFTFASDEH